MRGFFALGMEGISKPMNTGNLIRSAHAFGASFVFAVNAHQRVHKAKSDTSKTPDHLPFYLWDSVDDIVLPAGCALVGVELTEDAIDLPSFRHPLRAAYVLGPERGVLSDEMLSKCEHVVKIPTRFCINVATAGAIVMYDRVRSLGSFASRPVKPGAPEGEKARHVYGNFRQRTGKSLT
ncbi:MAG: RNA methyltransferase [Hyphomicrobiales bacterium]